VRTDLLNADQTCTNVRRPWLTAPHHAEVCPRRADVGVILRKSGLARTCERAAP